jgi:hypothetical protein
MEAGNGLNALGKYRIKERHFCLHFADGGFSVCAGVYKKLFTVNWNLSFTEGRSLHILLIDSTFHINKNKNGNWRSCGTEKI